MGERIGSERELAERLGVTRSELRSALDVLERDGQVRRTIGRAGGVFRWDGKIERHLNTIEGVPDMLRQQGFRPGTAVLSSGIGLASGVEARALRIAPGERIGIVGASGAGKGAAAFVTSGRRPSARLRDDRRRCS